MNDKKGVSEDPSNVNNPQNRPQLETEPKNNVFDFNQLVSSMPLCNSNELSRNIEALFHTRLQRQLQ
jgi:hypothetical protein